MWILTYKTDPIELLYFKAGRSDVPPVQPSPEPRRTASYVLGSPRTASHLPQRGLESPVWRDPRAEA